MIPKVPQKRRDGRSSFKELQAYITEELTKDPMTGETINKTLAIETVNLLDLETAYEEMVSVAKRNPRVNDPVFHFILTWPENEKPTSEQIMDSGKYALEVMGLAEHQAILAIHGNTPNLHVHISVNRVHPETFKSQHLEWTHKTLDKVCRELEIKFGWQHSNGMHVVVEVNGQKYVKLADDKDKEARKRPGTKAADYEIRTGEQSLETWCKDKPASDLKKCLASPKTKSWQDVHQVLAKHSLELRDSGGKGMKVFDTSDPAIPPVKASAVFRFANRKRLEERFGPFEAADPAQWDVKQERSYKRDPEKRLERKLERAAAREQLREAYRLDRQQGYDARKALEKDIYATNRERFKAIIMAKKARRDEIRASKFPPEIKQALYSVNAMQAAQEKEALRKGIIQEQQAFKVQYPAQPKTWRQFCEERAALGDEAAISALRGLKYDEERRKKKEAQEDKEDDLGIRSANTISSDPHVRNIQNVSWQVGRTGVVSYKLKDGTALFRDEGKKIIFEHGNMSDEAINIALQHAREKWGNEITLTGTDAAYHHRAARLAVAMGLKIKNPELQALQTTLENELTQQKPTRGRGQRQPTTTRISVQLSQAEQNARQELEAQIKHLHPSGQLQHAGQVDGRFRGSIIAENSLYVVQHVGKDKYVIHDRKEIGQQHRTGHDVTIIYKQGQVTVTTPKGKAQER